MIKGDVNKALENIGETKDLPVYYTNGTHLPVSADVSIVERIQKEHIFFPIVDGGNIMHIWMGEKSPNPSGLMDFAMNLCKKYKHWVFCVYQGYDGVFRRRVCKQWPAGEMP